MLQSLSRLLGGDPIRKKLETYYPLVAAINALEPTIKALPEVALKGKTAEFRSRLEAGETLDDLLPEAFAVVRETAVRTIGLRHFDVQLIGGIVLHEGTIAEMRTGEGKTLVATLPIYLNALEGRGVHLITVNDYLARRDARWMGPIFDYLGITVGVLQEAARTESGRKAFLYDAEKTSTQEDVDQLTLVDRHEAYQADVTYGTNNEFGFDYLRDNMARTLDRRSQRGHHYAILDEVDNILIDEARTPLIISGPSHEDPEQYLRMAQVVRGLRPEDFEVSEKDRTVALTEIGETHVEELLGETLRDPDRPEDITPEQARLLGHLEQALRAEHLYRRNKNYVVQAGKVIIVDEFTGRMMAGRRWSDGLHQAVEAKEGVKVRQENVTYATITLQNYFRKYSKLAGMTGTAVTEAEEFNKIYKVDVLPLPTNLDFISQQEDAQLVKHEYREDSSKFHFFARTDDAEQAPVFWVRKDYPDVVYRTVEAKFRAICSEILARHVIGQPLLVGTTSVELSEKLSGRLKSEMLQRLAQTIVLRAAYLEANNLEDDGRRINEVTFLYHPLEELNTGVLRSFARQLGVSLNPSQDDNVGRLASVLGIGTESIPELKQVLEAGVRHNVLNAKKHDEESRIIADAGALGAVTIATNMAGRGVDIKLGGEIAEEVLASVNRVLRRTGQHEEVEALSAEERLQALANADDEAIGIYGSEVQLYREFMQSGVTVRQVGGLHVLGSERHESRRIDNQLRGRAARQGDPGSSQFFLSLEDDLMRLFGGQQVSGLMQRLNIDDAMPIAHSMVDRTIEQAQTRVEGANFDTREHLLEYDDVLNQQREVYYGQRDTVLRKDDLHDDLLGMIEVEVERHVDLALAEEGGLWKLLAWLEESQPTLGLESAAPYPSFMLRLLLDELKGVTQQDAPERLLKLARRALETQYNHLFDSIEDQFGRSIERLQDQVRQRSELAELALEGALIEAEETETAPNPAALVAALEQAAGMRIKLEGEMQRQIEQDPDRLRRMIPQLIEAGLGMRVWSAVLQAVERRSGEALELDGYVPSLPIDWREAETRLLSGFETTWEKIQQRRLDEIARELEEYLAREDALSEGGLTQILIQMSFGRRTIFDRKTHRQRAIVIPRLTYAFSAAELLDSWSGEQLLDEIGDHLERALLELEINIGQSASARLLGMTLAQLDDRWRAGLAAILDAEVCRRLDELPNLADLPPDLKAAFHQALGHLTLTDAYRSLFVSVGDQLWVEYLTQMEALRTSIGLEAYGQRDPLVQYKSRAFDMFGQLLNDIRAGIVSRLFRLQTSARRSTETLAAEQPAPEKALEKPSAKKKRRKRR